MSFSHLAWIYLESPSQQNQQHLSFSRSFNINLYPCQTKSWNQRIENTTIKQKIHVFYVVVVLKWKHHLWCTYYLNRSSRIPLLREMSLFRKIPWWAICIYTVKLLVSEWKERVERREGPNSINYNQGISHKPRKFSITIN